MKNLFALISITLSITTATLFTSHLRENGDAQLSPYDIRTKCSQCGKWHIRGAPCQK